MAKTIAGLPVSAVPINNSDIFHINIAGVDYQVPASLVASSVSTLLGFTAFGESIAQSADADGARSILEAEQTANLLSAITTLQDTDELIISDASDSFLSRKITVANLKLAITGSTLKSIQTFTASGTWNKPAGINAVFVEVIGGGGGGGSTNSATGAGGGGGGGYGSEFITSGLGSSETVTIGAGGAGGAVGNNNGVSGGTSSFGAFVSATGGLPGNANGTGSVGGSGSGGDISLRGGAGTSGQTGGNLGGTGGSAARGGGGGNSRTSTIIPTTGVEGGGGAGGHNSVGAAGGSGIVIVYEYS